MPISNLRISEKGKRQLVSLKRHTGIKNWNVLCRWALCVSLSEETTPPAIQIPADSNVEMSWKVFAGSQQDILESALRMRCKLDRLPLDPENLHQQLRIHVHRGLGYLAGSSDIRTIGALCRLAASPSKKTHPVAPREPESRTH